jgi:hypothetical protein
MSARKRYDELVAESPQGSVFADGWWLDAVAPGAWEPHLVEDGELRAAWPTIIRRNRWGPLHLGASLTPFLGPLLPASADGKRRWTAAERAIELLLEELGPYAHLEARCHPAFAYWTPLSWHGFSQTTRYTWRLEGVSDIEAAEAALRPNIRGDIRKARKQGVAVVEGTKDELLELHRRTSTVERHVADATASTIESVDGPAAERSARHVLIARDEDGRAHAAGYFVRDARALYYLVGASDAELRSSGATSLLVWSGIELASSLGLAFDFEGSMIRPIERFFRAFGGEPVPYSVVRHTQRRGLRAERAVKRTVRGVRG